MGKKEARKQAIAEAQEMWEELVETGSDDKESTKAFKKYGKDCSLCEYDDLYNEAPDCEDCLLYQNGFVDCCNPYSPFEKWDSAKTPRTRKKYAKQFLAVLKQLK